MKLRVVFYASVVTLALTVFSVSKVNAAQVINNSIRTNHIYPKRGLQLAKEGYVFRIDGDKHNSGIWSLPTGSNKRNLTSKKELRRIIKDKTRVCLQTI